MKFFFDIRLPDAIATDHEGIHLETVEEALAAARVEAAGLVSDAERWGEALLAIAVIVRDASGEIIAEVPVHWEASFDN